MALVRGRGHLYRERPSVAPSVASSVAPLNFFLPLELGNKLFNQPAGPSEMKPLIADALIAATNIFKYSENDLQRIFKAVLEAQTPVSNPALAPSSAPAPSLALAPVVFEVPREKLKAHFPDMYRGKSHIDCYNFCQQCEDYFATAGATEPTRIPFAASFLWDRISFRWQQYKQRHDKDISVLVTWNKFKMFF